MTSAPRDPKAQSDARRAMTTSEKIDEVEDAIRDAREHLEELDENARRRDEEE